MTFYWQSSEISLVLGLYFAISCAVVLLSQENNVVFYVLLTLGSYKVRIEQ